MRSSRRDQGMTLNSCKRDFDQEAAAWDTPPRIQLAQDVASAMMRHLPLASDMDVLDFGCGTGILSLALLPHVRSVTGVDTSQGMLDVFNDKIRRGNIAGAKTLHLDLFKGKQGNILPGSFLLIVSNMTLHHIQDISLLFSKFHDAILPGGYLAVADLDPEGGLFHDNPEGVFHNGFDRQVLREIFAKTGFSDIHDFPAAEVMKPASDGTVRRFVVFLMTARKPAGKK